MNVISEIDKAYIAGFVDGEGCITISKCVRQTTPTPIYSVVVRIGSTSKRIIDYLISIIGAGNVQSSHYNKNHSPMYHWYLSSALACQFIKQIYPYLIIKREEADLAIEFQKTMGLPLIKDEKYRNGGMKVSSDIINARENLYHRIQDIKGISSRNHKQY